MQPDLSRVSGGFTNYIKLVTEPDISSAFKSQQTAYFDFLESIPEAKRQFRYAEGKWDSYEIIQHLIDCERVFTYRALRLARKDVGVLSPFDEEIFAKNADAESRSWASLMQEFKAVRTSSELMFESFSLEQLDAGAIVGDMKIYVLALGFTIVGHARHHENIFRERYLKA